MYLYLFVILCACILVRAQGGRVVNTSQGVVIGTPNNGYMAFYGIPYAGPTSGENRFKAPTPAPIFPEPFYAYDFDRKLSCIGPDFIEGTEDCLTLSVFTTNTTTSKPVIVLIFGEQFATDRYQFLPDTLVQSDLVVVKVNYRRSIFGFLCLGVTDAPGNAGLKDIVQALKWIKDNIAGFGGDPNNVVLLGHESGAAMVDLLTLSPLATGLMHKAIALSGSALAPWAVSYDPVVQARDIGDRIGYTGKDNEELAKILINTDIDTLVSEIDDGDFPNNTVLFGPCIEDRNLNPNDTFLSDFPLNILRSGKYSDIPYIAAYTNGEGTINPHNYPFDNWIAKMYQNFSAFIQVDLNFETKPKKDAIINLITDFYFSQIDQIRIDEEFIEEYLDYQGDTTIVVPVLRNVKERALTSKSEVRQLEFAYNGDLTARHPFPQFALTRARHGEILNFLFNYGLIDTHYIVKDTLIKRLTAFAYTGNPNPVNENFINWLPVEPTVPYSLYMKGSFTTGVFKEELKFNLNRKEIEFWENLYSTYYVPPKSVSSASELILFSFMILISQVVPRLL